MSHVRKQIRDRVATLLSPVATVYLSRAYPLAEGALPCILVYTSEEQVEIDDFSKLRRSLQVIVEAVVQPSGPVDDALDALAASVEAAIAADFTLNGLAMQCVLAATSVTVSAEGSAPIGRARMTFEALYRTAFSDPETAL